VYVVDYEHSQYSYKHTHLTYACKPPYAGK